jgi:cysteine-rich repeat protein
VSGDLQTQIGTGIAQQVQFNIGQGASSSKQSFILPVPGESSSALSSSTSSAGPQFMSVAPGNAVCGNGIIETGEQCDNGPLNSDTRPGACRTNCTVARCGDGTVDPGEECDKGDADNAIGNGCTPICKISVCGDGILQPGEECDDGHRNSDTKPDSCSTHCLLPRCGDGIVDRAFGEVCDNGAQNSDTKPDACRMNCAPARCGDGVKDTGEQCDDGAKNGTPGDSCNDRCVLVAAPALHTAAGTEVGGPFASFWQWIIQVVNDTSSNLQNLVTR